MSEQNTKIYEIQPSDVRKAAEFLRSRSALSVKKFYDYPDLITPNFNRVDNGELPSECCAIGALGWVLKQEHFPSIGIDHILYDLLDVVDIKFSLYQKARGNSFPRGSCSDE